MPRRLLMATLSLLGASSLPAQSPDPTPQSPPPQQDSTAPASAKQPKKVWTNEDVKAAGPVSVVGDSKNKPKTTAAKNFNGTYAASVRKQLDKLQKQIEDVDKQILDLKKFKEGDPSNNAAGLKINKSYNREPIDVQIQKLQDQKKDLQAQIDALLDEARKRGVEPGQLR